MNLLEKLNQTKEEFLNSQTIKDLSKPLSTADLLKDPAELKLGSFEFSSPADSALTLTASASASTSIQLFNSDADDDTDDLLASADPNGFIPFDPDSPVLKYDFSLKAGAEGNVKLGKLGLGIQANAQLQALSYVRHQPTSLLGIAIGSDVANMPVIISKNDVAQLKSGNAVAIETAAKLGASLSFELSDLFTSGLSGLSKFLKTQELISLNIKSGVTVGAHYSLSDSYQLVFVNDPADSEFDLKVSVNKTKSQRQGFSINAGVSVQFDNPEVFSNAVNAQIDNLVSQITGVAENVYTDIKQKVDQVIDPNSLTPDETAALQKLLDYFGIGDVDQKYEELKTKLATLQTDITETITDTAKQKLQVSIGFEYSKISSSSTLLKAKFNSSVLDKAASNGKTIFANLILFNPQPLINEAATNTTDIQVSDFLKQSMSKEDTKWGITIGFGKFKFGGADTTSREFNITENLEGHQQVVFDGVRGYNEVGTLGGYSHDWSVGFNPAMTTFSAGPEPLPQEFDNSFTLGIEELDKRFRGNKKERKKIQQVIDTAVCWGIIPLSDQQSSFDKVWNTLEAGKKKGTVTFNTGLNFTPAAFKAIAEKWLQLMSNTPVYRLFLAQAFAKSMPYLDGFGLRESAKARKAAYTPLWLGYLNAELPSNSPTASPREYAIAAQNHLKSDDLQLANYEGRLGSGSFGSILQMNNKTPRRWRAFNEGMKNYLELYVHNSAFDYHSTIKSTFNDIKSVWAQSYDTRVFGAYLTDLAQFDESLFNQIDSVLTIKYQDSNGQSQQMIFKNQQGQNS